MKNMTYGTMRLELGIFLQKGEEINGDYQNLHQASN